MYFGGGEDTVLYGGSAFVQEKFLNSLHEVIYLELFWTQYSHHAVKWSNPLYTACTALHCTALPYTTLHYTAWLLMTVRAIASRCRAFRDPSRWTCVLIETSKYDESSCMLASYPMVFRTVWYEYFMPMIYISIRYTHTCWQASWGQFAL